MFAYSFKSRRWKRDVDSVAVGSGKEMLTVLAVFVFTYALKT